MQHSRGQGAPPADLSQRQDVRALRHADRGDRVARRDGQVLAAGPRRHHARAVRAARRRDRSAIAGRRAPGLRTGDLIISRRRPAGAQLERRPGARSASSRGARASSTSAAPRCRACRRSSCSSPGFADLVPETQIDADAQAPHLHRARARRDVRRARRSGLARRRRGPATRRPHRRARRQAGHPLDRSRPAPAGRADARRSS